MKKTRFIWDDNVVATKIVANKLTFLCGVYENNHLIKANVFEQMLATAPGEKDAEPVLVKELTSYQMPVLFSMSGGHRYQVKLEQEVIGLKFEIEPRVHGRLKKVKEVRYKVVSDYILYTDTRHELKETGREFLFRACHSLKLPHLHEDAHGRRMNIYVPVFMLPEGETEICSTEGLYPRGNHNEKLLLLGCNTFDKGRFVGFIPAQKLPQELVNYFSR